MGCFQRSGRAVAGVFYGLTLLALSIALTAFVRYAAEHRRLVKDELRRRSPRSP